MGGDAALARPRPRGSRSGDVTWARIVRGGLARIERGRIPSRWARTARAGVDGVALGSHCASRPRVRTGSGPGIPLSGPAIYASRSRSRPAWARPAPARGRSGSRRGPGPGPRPIPPRPGSRDRRATREIMPLADVLAGRPAISTPALAGRVMIPRPGRSPLDRPCAHMRLSDDPATRAEPPPRRGGADEERGGDRFAAPVRETDADERTGAGPRTRTGTATSRTAAPRPEPPARGPRARRRGGRQLRLGQPGRGPRARRRASPGRTAMHRGDVGPSTAPSRSSATPLHPSLYEEKGRSGGVRGVAERKRRSRG